jgi:hypothetical protein
MGAEKSTQAEACATKGDLALRHNEFELNGALLRTGVGRCHILTMK